MTTQTEPLPDLTLYTTGALVDEVIRITHRITCDRGAQCSDCNNLRDLRDVARAELIRRAGA